MEKFSNFNLLHGRFILPTFRCYVLRMLRPMLHMRPMYYRWYTKMVEQVLVYRNAMEKIMYMYVLASAMGLLPRRMFVALLRKTLRRDVSSIFPDSGQLLSPKCTLTATRLVTHAGSTVAIYMVDGEPLFFNDDGTLFPTGLSLIEWEKLRLL